LSTAVAKLRHLFNFHLLFYYDMVEAPSSTFNPRARRLLQLQSLSPTSSLFNFNLPRQLHPSSPPTSTLVAIQIPNPVTMPFPPFPLMAAVVCLMLLLPHELLTKIIIHSFKDVAIFRFLNLHNKICGTFRRICNSDEVLLHMSLRDLRSACKNRYVRSFFERRFHEANHPEALCFEGMVRLMRRQNLDKGLKLIEDAAATEDSSAMYFLAMLKYCCNPADPEAMALLQEISGGLSPPNGRWKNHNLRRLRYLVKQDLDNTTWLYWLHDGDGDDDIPLLPVQNANIYIWEVGCRHYGPDTKEIIHYCSAECRIRHEFDLWTHKFRPAVEYAVSRMNIGM
jgi:hypothetical protein